MSRIIRAAPYLTDGRNHATPKDNSVSRVTEMRSLSSLDPQLRLLRWLFQRNALQSGFAMQPPLLSAPAPAHSFYPLRSKNQG